MTLTKAPWGEVRAESHIHGASVTIDFDRASEEDLTLMQAAPLLLKSLGECLAIVRLQNGNLHKDINTIQKNAVAAIAKAEGTN